MKPNLRIAYRWISQFIDPFRAGHALARIILYLQHWQRYTHLPYAEPLRLADSYPQLHDTTATSVFDAHYFYSNGWATRRIVSCIPQHHVDIGSQVMVANVLSAVIPVTFIDYRPLEASIAGLTSCGGDILALPFASNSVNSLSCLHVAEHIGLGRYGDPLNPAGTRQACVEMQRVLSEEGNLYLSLPIGRQRTCFNAHRIHSPQTVIDFFPQLHLMEFSAVCDDGEYVEHADPSDFNNSDYACGMFWFRKRRDAKSAT